MCPGPPPTPAEMLRLRKEKLYGIQRDRSLNAPVAVESLEPICPDYFKPAEVRAWDFLATILKNYGLYKDINAPVLEQAAVYLAEFRKAHSLLSKGRWLYTRGDRRRKNPYFDIREQAHAALRRCLTDLNISAAGLVRLGGSVAKNKEKVDDFFED
jgi:hypothetical protein